MFYEPSVHRFAFLLTAELGGATLAVRLSMCPRSVLPCGEAVGLGDMRGVIFVATKHKVWRASGLHGSEGLEDLVGMVRVRRNHPRVSRLEENQLTFDV